YIDPPYNTGKDFIYDDNFTEPLEEYLRRTGQIDEEGKPLTTNKKSDGRFHSKWLSMMYPRLKMSKNLLSDDGVIFISIGDNELQHLKCILNEIFGEENFISVFVWNTDGHTDNQLEVKINHEYIICYQKDSSCTALYDVVDPNTREESNLWKGFAENSITKNGSGNPPSYIILPKGFPCKLKQFELPKSKVDANFFLEVEKVGFITRELTKEYDVTYPIRMNKMIAKDYKLAEECKVYTGWANVNKLKSFISSGFEPLEEDGSKVSFYISPKGVIYYRRDRESAKNILSVLKGFTTTEKTRSNLEQDGIYFQYPKPVDLIKYILEMGINEGEIVLDYFAGSGTTGHALYEFNVDKENNSKFILIQMAEFTDEKSLAYQKGFKTIDKICKKRLATYSKKIKSKIINSGFKAFSYNYSNFKQWKDYDSKELSKLESLFENVENSLVEGWEIENLITEILLIEGFPLDSKIEEIKEYKKNKTRQVTSDFCEHKLLICLDKKVHPETIKNLQLGDTDIFICLDNAITDEEKVTLSDKGLIKTI
ncbi:MAG: site-specific DNA-methyltransferase, partial [Ignavibacteria bacterium]|nr:site-specific DNA-methyltransferase [Ignavibacteria bacterium]